MHDGSALAGELAHEGERDDGLAAAGAAGDDDGGLLVRVAGAVDGVEDVLVGGALLVEEHELFAVLDLVRGDGEQLARRGGGAAHEQVGGVGAAAGREVLAQVVDEVAAPLAGEHPPVLGRRAGEEVFDAEVGRVVQVGGADEAVRLIREGRGEVGEVLDIPRDLDRGVEHAAVAVLIDAHERVVVLETARAAPLLELEDHVGGVAGARVRPRKDDVGALARQRQPVFEEHLDAAQAGVDEVGPKLRDAARPRPLLTRRRPGTRLDRHLLGQPLGKVGLQGRQALRGRAKQIHGRNPRQHEVGRAGGGVSVVEARRAAMTLSG